MCGQQLCHPWLPHQQHQNARRPGYRSTSRQGLRFRPEAANFFSQNPPKLEVVDRKLLQFKSELKQLTIYNFQLLRTTDFPAGPCYRRYFPGECRTCPEDSTTDSPSAPSSMDMRGVS